VEDNGQCCSDTLLSQQMLEDAIIASFITICLWARQCTGSCCIQHSPTASMQNSL